MSCILGLLVLGVGYLVFAGAAKEKERGVQILGLVIGVIVMVGAAMSVACEVKCKAGICGPAKGMCPFSAKDKAHAK